MPSVDPTAKPVTPPGRKPASGVAAARPATGPGLAGDVYVPAARPAAWAFSPGLVRGAYDATADRTPVYDMAAILADVPAIWRRAVAADMRGAAATRARKAHPGETWGQLFGRVATAAGVDPYALATYCVFESYDARRGSFNPHMREAAGGMLAAGVAATQAQDWAGKPIPGTKRRFPAGREATARTLREEPELALRCLAAEMKAAYAAKGDLATAFPAVAYPAWGDPRRARGNYGTQAQYVSRAHALYEAFKAADRT